MHTSGLRHNAFEIVRANMTVVDESGNPGIRWYKSLAMDDGWRISRPSFVQQLEPNSILVMNEVTRVIKPP